MSRWSEVIGLAVLAGALSALAAPQAPASSRGSFKKDAAKVEDAGTEASEAAAEAIGDEAPAVEPSRSGESAPAHAATPAPRPIPVPHEYSISASAPKVEGAVVQSRELADGVIDVRKPMFGAINCPPRDADYDK